MPPSTKRKQRNRKTDWLIGAGALFVATILFVLAKNYYNTHFVRYGRPGIFVPEQYSVHGIDVSHHQGAISWKGVSKMAYKHMRIQFVFMKATQGSYFVDPHFDRNWRQAGRAGVPRGAYHFFDPSQNAIDQVENFRKKVKLNKGDLPPVLDVERRGNLPLFEFHYAVLTWLQEVERIYGVRPIVYTYASFYRDYLSPILGDYPLWVAHYTNSAAPSISRNWHFWQLSDRSNIDGISTFVDFNVFNGTAAEFDRMRIGH